MNYNLGYLYVFSLGVPDASKHRRHNARFITDLKTNTEVKNSPNIRNSPKMQNSARLLNKGNIFRASMPNLPIPDNSLQRDSSRLR